MEELTDTQKVIILLIVGIPLIMIIGMILFIGSVEAEEIKTLYGNTSKIGGVTFNNINNPIWINTQQEANKAINVTIGFYYDTYTEKPFNNNDKINVVLKACMTGQTIAAVTSTYYNQIDYIYDTKRTCNFSNWTGTLYEVLMTLNVDNVYYDDIDSDEGTIFIWYVAINQSSLYLYNNDSYNVSIIWKQFDYMKKSNYDSYLEQLRASGVQNEILTIQSSINNNIINQTQSITNAQNSTTNAVNGTTSAINDMANQDLDNNTKQQVDTTDVNNYNQKEQALMQVANTADLSGVNIGLNQTASSNIWQLVTRLINTNEVVYTLFISILSIGIIKLMLAR